MNPCVILPQQAELEQFCRDNGIRWFAIYGSALRDDFGPESDINVLVDFMPDRIPGLLGVVRMEIALSGLFGGRKVDLRTPNGLSRYFRQDVLDTAETHYGHREQASLGSPEAPTASERASRHLVTAA